jgi:hypothetical protein
VSDDDIDVLIISVMLNTAGKETNKQKAEAIVRYWHDKQRSQAAHPWRSFRRARPLTKVGVTLIVLGWLAQCAMSVYLLTTL